MFGEKRRVRVGVRLKGVEYRGNSPHLVNASVAIGSFPPFRIA